MESHSKQRVLILASVASMIDQFNMSNIKVLQSLGYEIHVACNFILGSSCTDEKIVKLKRELKEMNVKYFQIDFARSVAKITQNYTAYKQVKKLMKHYHYAFIHCHSPIGGVIGRIAGHFTDTKVMYTAHGFHFYKGAPIQNWMLYYPVEWFLSKWTDVLITINHEDYTLAQKRFHAKKLEYISGVGVKINNFSVTDRAEYNKIRSEKRKEIGLSDNDFVIMSTGELNENKNHSVIIEAISLLHDPAVKYIICGQGALESTLTELIHQKGLQNQVKLLGFRTDIRDLLYASDVFAFPSRREGLGLSAIEAMAAGLPLITSNVHGINDYSVNGKSGYSRNSEDKKGFANAIKRLKKSDREAFSKYNTAQSGKYDSANIDKRMRVIYSNV